MWDVIFFVYDCDTNLIQGILLMKIQFVYNKSLFGGGVMINFLSDAASIHNVSFLKNELEIFMNRQKIIIEESLLRQSTQVLLQNINECLTNQNEIIKSIAMRWNQFIDSWVHMKQQYQAQIQEMNDEIDQKFIAIDNLQEIVTHLQKKIENYQQKIAHLKNCLLNTSQKAVNTHNQYIRLKQEAIILEKNRDDISKINKQKLILMDQIKQQREINDEIKYNILIMKAKIQQLQKQCKKQQLKCDNLTKQCSNLQDIIDQTKIQLKNRCIGIKQEIEIEQKIQNFNNQDIFLNSFRFSNQSIDPYFTHFVLISQSVKIKEESEELLGIDVKPFYSQIISKRIPMHIWDQWIHNKLKSIMRQQRQKANSQ